MLLHTAVTSSPLTLLSISTNSFSKGLNTVCLYKMHSASGSLQQVQEQLLQTMTVQVIEL